MNLLPLLEKEPLMMGKLIGSGKKKEFIIGSEHKQIHILGLSHIIMEIKLL